MSLGEWERKVRARDAQWEPFGGNAQTKAVQVNKRLRSLAKKMKVQNPVHLLQVSLTSAFPSVSTTGTIYDLSSAIIQGDDYFNRFSSQVYLRRVNIKGVMLPGSAAGNPTIARISLIRAVSGLVFASNMSGSYSPIVTGTSLQVLSDKFYTLGSYTNIGFPVNLNISIKLRHKQKFSGVGAGTGTGDCLYLIMQSGVVAGTAAPSVSGVMEIFFDPM